MVLGHEFAMTIVGVDQGPRERCRVGDRLTLETGIVVKGKTYAYGYLYRGGLSQYSVIGPEVYASDLGNNLIKVRTDKGYAENALTEPWACVVAAYGLKYRTGLKQGGITWIIGAGGDRPYTINSGFDAGSHPTCLLLTDVPARFTAWVKERAAQLGVEVTEVPSLAACPVEFVDDIVVLDPVPTVIAEAGSHLALQGVMNIYAGVARGTLAALDLSGAYLSGTRIIGHSASLMSDFELVLAKTNSGELSPNRSVAAVGSSSAARDGLKAVKGAALTGKVVIYPNIKELPLTPLAAFKEKLPTVYLRLNARGE